jgi:hypothetical protein
MFNPALNCSIKIYSLALIKLTFPTKAEVMAAIFLLARDSDKKLAVD